MKLTLNASISHHTLRMLRREDLQDIEKIAPHLIFSRGDMTAFGHINVGTVEIDVELLPPDQIVGNAIIALRAKAASIRAKATAEATVLEGQARELLAIENRPGAPE